jgi:hypothetical protein
MNAMHLRRDPMLLSAILCGILLCMPAGAAQRRLPDVAALTTPLGCQIQGYKVVVITNTTGATIPAGTAITFDAIRVPDHAHVVRTVTGGAIAPGGIIQIGVGESYSCTAWTPRVLVMAP